jgi:hypothetical protein
MKFEVVYINFATREPALVDYQEIFDEPRGTTSVRQGARYQARVIQKGVVTDPRRAGHDISSNPTSVEFGAQLSQVKEHHREYNSGALVEVLAQRLTCTCGKIPTAGPSGRGGRFDCVVPPLRPVAEDGKSPVRSHFRVA